MYKSILVPLDGSKLAEQVLPYVSLLAKAHQTPIQLLRVFDPVTHELAGQAGGQYTDRLATAFRNDATTYLGQVATSLRSTGVEISVAALEGDPASHIISEAERHPETLVAMTTHGRSGVGRWVLGSITDKVLHSTTSLMLITRAKSDEEFSAEVSLGMLIVPLDGSLLAEQSLPYVAALAQPLDAKVSLVRVTPSVEELMGAISTQQMEVTFGADLPSPEALAQEGDGNAKTYLDRIKEGLNQQGATSVDTQVLHGTPAAAIVDFARGASDNLTVITTHGRSGLGRWLLGSVTDRVVRDSGNPVLVVRSS
ncbi:MAG: hypothetical protein BZY80_05860 [SAR202 cluster bacterium Io17-Chloro-G2]|nr:MAG: hypothetical protein BZY80_05860 [SAR202 cluster bacterium Io17-Chloro-G2]